MAGVYRRRHNPRWQRRRPFWLSHPAAGTTPVSNTAVMQLEALQRVAVIDSLPITASKGVSAPGAAVILEALKAIRAVTASYLPTVLADTPTLLWELAEASGTAAADASGNGNGGTYTGTPSLGQTGPVPGFTAMKVNAPGDYVTGGSFAYPGGNITIECWLNTGAMDLHAGQSFGFMELCGIYSGSYAAVLYLNYNFAGGAFVSAYANAGGDKYVNGTAPVSDGNWHHLAMTITSSGNMFLYVDGVQDGGATAVGSLYGAVSFPFRAGEGDSANFSFEIGGMILGWAALYPVALTAAQIAAHASALGPGAITLDVLRGVAATGSFTVEAVQAVQATVGDPVDGAQAVAPTVVLPVEEPQGVQATDVLQVHEQQGIAATGQQQLDELGTTAVAQTVALPLDETQAITATTADPVDETQAVQANAADPVTSGQGVSATVGDPVDETQGLASTDGLPLDEAQRVAGTGQAAVDETQPVSTSGLLPVTAGQAVTVSLQVPFSALTGVAATVQEIIDELGTIAVSQTVSLPIDALQGVAVAASVVADDLQRLAAVSGLNAEEQQAAAATLQTVWEALQGVAGVVVVLAEAKGGVASTGLLQVDTTMLLSVLATSGVDETQTVSPVSVQVPIEAIRGVTAALVSLPVETLLRLAALRDLSEDTVNVLAALAELPFEIRTGIDRIGEGVAVAAIVKAAAAAAVIVKVLVEGDAATPPPPSAAITKTPAEGEVTMPHVDGEVERVR